MNNLPKITVISAWRNEDLIAPFFLKHYLEDIGVDQVHILLDSSTNDNTRSILETDLFYKLGKVSIHDLNYYNGFCDEQKIDAVNYLYRQVSEGWVISCDADEFVFHEGHISGKKTMKQFLSELEENVSFLNSNMYHPFRNVLDEDLDVLKQEKVVFQRRYGTKVPPTTDKIPVSLNSYKKPNVIKSCQNVHWSVGHHVLFDAYRNEIRVSEEIMGVHWKYADESFIVKSTNERIENFQHIKKNVDRGLGHHWIETLEEALTKCKDHMNDDKMF